jgi:cytochrome P450
MTVGVPRRFRSFCQSGRCVAGEQAAHHTFAPGTPIVTYLIGSNRDERWIPGGARLDVTRSGAGSHLAFGGGAHKCPGRHLAKMIIEVGLAALVTRLDGLRLDGEVVWDTENLPSVMPRSVPVAWNTR